MPLSVSDGLGAWVDDFKKSDAPQFKGKSAKERREMAIAAYLSAKRGDKNEAYDNPPFTPDPPKKDVKNSDQTKQSPMSRAKALAKKARDAQKTNENNSAPQTAAHRRAMMVGVMKKRAQDNEKARQALKDPDHNPAWANSKSKLEATIRGKEAYDKTFANRTQADNFAKKNGGRVRQIGRVFYVFKESVNEGRPSQQHPLEDHPYHRKTDAQLTYIGKDAHAAAEAMKGHNTEKENKYRDQANDAATVRHFRKKSGMPDWYKKKYGHGVKESVELDESVAKAYEIMKPTKSMNHGIEAIKKTMKIDHGTATRLARQVMDKVKKGEFKEGTADRYKLIKKIGDKLNKEKKKAERDAMKHAKRDNEYQTEGKAEEVKGAAAANSGESYSSNPYPRGTPEHLSWSKGHNKARARRLNMGEEFTMKHYRKNEDENRHSENALQLAKKFGSKKEIETVQGIHDRHMKRGHITEPDRSTRDKIARKHYPKLKETTSVKKTNEATQFKVDVEGLPPTFMNGKSVGEILARLRKIVKQPSMIQSVDRVTAHDVKKTYRDKSQGKED